MIERLSHALQVLATPAGVRPAEFSDVAADVDGLALDYADALRLAIDCQQVQLATNQRSALEQLGDYLDELRDGTDAERWRADTRRTGAEWTTVRALATAALQEVGIPRAAN